MVSTIQQMRSQQRVKAARIYPQRMLPPRAEGVEQQRRWSHLLSLVLDAVDAREASADIVATLVGLNAMGLQIRARGATDEHGKPLPRFAPVFLTGWRYDAPTETWIATVADPPPRDGWESVAAYQADLAPLQPIKVQLAGWLRQIP